MPQRDHHPSCPRRGWADGTALDRFCICPAGKAETVSTPEDLRTGDGLHVAIAAVAGGPEYEWRCFGTIVCDSMFDSHGRECDRLNDEARSDFYADVLLSTPLGDLT